MKFMDVGQARDRLATIEATLRDVEKLKQESVAIRKLLDAYDELDRIESTTAPILLRPPLSMRQAMLDAMRSFDGKQFTTRQLFQECVLRGASTKARRPLSVVEGFLYERVRLKEVKKIPIKTATWRYLGESDKLKSHQDAEPYEGDADQ